MDILPGRRKGSYIYIYDSYIYNIDCRNKKIFRCHMRYSDGCKGIVIKIDENYVLKAEHNHDPEELAVEIHKMKAEMFSMCRETSLPFKDIFDTVCRSNPRAAVQISYVSLKSVMQRARAQSKPPLPRTLEDFKSCLENDGALKSIYKGCVIDEDGNMAFFFSTESLLKQLSDSTEMYIDGTFDLVPHTPSFRQLYSIHVRYMDKGIPVLFILCQNKKKKLYTALWQKLIELAPGLQDKLQFIMSDYERAVITTLTNQFPNASQHGCWFHYKQAITRKWRSLKLTNTSSELLRIAMAVPLLPHQKFQEAFAYLQKVADDLSLLYPSILQFVSYLRLTWLPMASKVSVYGCPSRTNNIVEAFHSNLRRKFRTAYPNLWEYLENLSKCLLDKEIDLQRLRRGLQISRPRSRFDRERYNRIEKAQEDLMAGRLPVDQFLRSFLHSLETECHAAAVHETDKEEKHEVDDEQLPAHLSAVTLNTAEQISAQSSDTSFPATTGDNISNPGTLIAQEDITKSHSNTSIDSACYTVVAEEVSAQPNDILVLPISAGENVSILEDASECIYIVPEDYDNDINEGILEVNDVPRLLTNAIDFPKSTEGKGLCSICLINLANKIFVPCGHLCCCEECTSNYTSELCPLCRNHYTHCVRVITT